MTRLPWASFPPSPAMHVVHVAGATALTLCQERHATDDCTAVDGEPEYASRCDACVRVLVDRRWIERGLAELVEVAP
jgi:hypothetical protein